jgi:hypothetical protein
MFSYLEAILIEFEVWTNILNLILISSEEINFSAHKIQMINFNFNILNTNIKAGW